MIELLRAVVRSMLGYDSVVYRGASRWLNRLSIVRAEGVGMLRQLTRLEAANPALGQTESLRLRRLSHPFLVRAGTEDIATVVNNVIREEYGQFLPQAKPAWMLDAGAYIGDTSAYFLSRFPELRVVALEPDSESIAMARRNLAAYGERSILFEEGLWGRDEEIAIGGSFTGTRVGEGERRIRGVSIPTLLDRLGIERLDILKMDIEGAEKSVFASAPEQWLPRVGCLIVEFHGSDLERDAVELLSKAGFEAIRFRSLIYFLRSQGG